MHIIQPTTTADIPHHSVSSNEVYTCTLYSTFVHILHNMVHFWYTFKNASRYIDWLRAGRSGDRIPAGARFFAHVQTGPGAHPASYTMGTVSFSGVKTAGAWCWPLIQFWCRGQESVELYLYPLWAFGSVRGTFTFTSRYSRYPL
jgi:hypothetical protein